MNLPQQQLKIKVWVFGELSPSGAVADKSLYVCDCTSPLAVIDGKIVLTKLIQQRPGEDTLIVDEYDVKENTMEQEQSASSTILRQPPEALIGLS